MDKRTELKNGLTYLGLFGGVHLHTFRLMYSHLDLSAPIDVIVDEMRYKDLDWALTQVQNSIDKLHKA